MTESAMYRVSLHVSHPVIGAEKIVSMFGLQPRYSRSVGSLRLTKSGHELGGSYSNTDVSFYISDGVISNDDITVAEFLDAAFDRLPLQAVSEIIGTGGRCFFMIGIYVDGSVICDFCAPFLLKISAQGIGLKLDFYGGEGSAI